MKTHKKKAFAFTQTKIAALITAVLLLAVLSAVGCSRNEDGSDGSVTAQASTVTDGASLILSPDNLTISVKAITADGSAVTVEGCTETTLASGTETTLHAHSSTVILKGKITELDCRDNQLTALNVQGLNALQELGCIGNQLTELDVQGLSALQWLDCSGNQLNAQALTNLLTDLPARSPRDEAECILYTERTEEGNYTDFEEFTAPADLYTALQNAVTKNWKLCYWDSDGNNVEL